MKKILTILLPITLLGKIYLLPYEKDKALKEIVHNIRISKNSIKGAIYAFTNKTIAKELKKAAARGVKIELIFDKEYNLNKIEKSMLFYLAKYKNIEIYLLQGKPYKKSGKKGIMHIKAMIFDGKRVILGSANWTYSAFNNNYETIYSIKEYKIAKKFEKYYDMMKRESIKFK